MCQLYFYVNNNLGLGRFLNLQILLLLLTIILLLLGTNYCLSLYYLGLNLLIMNLPSIIMDFSGIRNIYVHNVVVIFYYDLATLDKSKKTGNRKGSVDRTM